MTTNTAENSDMAEVERLKALMLKKCYYVMFRQIARPELLKSVLLDHYQWIIGLEKEGKIFASGPLFSSDGKQGVGMTIIRAETQAEAEEIAAGDPFCTSGAAEFEVQRWQINEGRVTLSIDFSDQAFSIE